VFSPSLDGSGICDDVIPQNQDPFNPSLMEYRRPQFDSVPGIHFEKGVTREAD
jgi:hypothetical protein